MRSFLLFLLLFVFTDSLLAEITVQVRVSGKPELKNQVGSFIKREIRGLHDVTLAEANPTHIIEIVALETKLETGASVGYSLSVVVLSPFATNTLCFFTNNEALPFFMGYCTNHYIIESHLLRGGANLRHLCETTVAAIDTSVFDDDRHSSEVIAEALRKAKQSRQASQ